MKLPYVLAAVALAAALAAGCGSSAEPRDDDDDGGSSGNASGQTTSGATTGQGGNTSTGAAQGGNTTQTTGAGAGTVDDSLYPIDVGHTWTYEVLPVGGGAVCAAGTHSTSVLGTEMIDGRETYEITNWCSAVSGTENIARGDGEEVHLYYNGSWLRIVAEPVEAGYSWDYFNTSYTWEPAGAVTVPAGTFDGCWTARQNVSYTAYQTFCPGVGIVRSYSQDLAGGGWDAQLSSTSF